MFNSCLDLAPALGRNKPTPAMTESRSMSRARRAGQYQKDRTNPRPTPSRHGTPQTLCAERTQISTSHCPRSATLRSRAGAKRSQNHASRCLDIGCHIHAGTCDRAGAKRTQNSTIIYPRSTFPPTFRAIWFGTRNQYHRVPRGYSSAMSSTIFTTSGASAPTARTAPTTTSPTEKVSAKGMMSVRRSTVTVYSDEFFLRVMSNRWVAWGPRKP
jgi:hypothetical protein